MENCPLLFLSTLFKIKIRLFLQGQKELYLNYRKVFMGDATDIFEKRKVVEKKTGANVAVTVGPSPFSGMTNAAAIAMASALNRPQPTRKIIPSPPHYSHSVLTFSFKC